ncbi:MAG: recombination mediator RecR [Rhodospirillaceae bacterium]
MSNTDIDRLISLLAKLPGLGPRSARRAVLHLIRRPDSLMQPLARALDQAADTVKTCGACGNIDTTDPCGICGDPRRDEAVLCVVEDVADLWALERSATFKGLYHVLGGALSALDGVTPDDLRIPALAARAGANGIGEVILALSATVDGQTTAHYIAERIGEAAPDVTVSGLAHGVPVGGELDYLDDGTLTAAMKARRPITK